MPSRRADPVTRLANALVHFQAEVPELRPEQRRQLLARTERINSRDSWWAEYRVRNLAISEIKEMLGIEKN